MFSDAYLANAFGGSLVVCRADFTAATSSTRLARLVSFSAGLRFADMDIGEQKIVSGADGFQRGFSTRGSS